MLQNKQEDAIKLSKWSYHETLPCKYTKAKNSKEINKAQLLLALFLGFFFLAFLIK